MELSTGGSFRDRVLAQLELLRSGDPLGAFDLCYAEELVMFDNGRVFARGKSQARAIQAGFIQAAREIEGDFPRLALDEVAEVSVLHNRSRFVDSTGKKLQIDGVHWQRWRRGFIVEERYYRGEQAAELIANGIFETPAIEPPLLEP